MSCEPDRLGRRLAGALPGLARLRLLLLHRRVEAGGVDRDAARAQRVLGQIEREAEGVVELERGVAGQRVALLELARRVLEQADALRQRPLEARLLEVQRLGDERLRPLQLVVGVAHLVHERGHEPVHQRLGRAEQVRVAHGAAHDAAEHVAAALVGGQHAVGDEEARRAQVVGDDAVRGLVLARRRHASRRDGRGDQRLEQVDLVVVVRALQHGGDALQPHAGVDRVLGQIDALAFGVELLVLHEHEVPDLDEAVAVGIRWSRRRAAGDLVAVVVEDLRARAARARVAHLPEVVGGRDADDLVGAEAGRASSRSRTLPRPR